MICFKGREYCATNTNKCVNTKCNRHLKTTDKNYKLSNNKFNLPVSQRDMSDGCDKFNRI